MSDTDAFSTTCVHSDDGFDDTSDVRPPIHPPTALYCLDHQFSLNSAASLALEEDFPHAEDFYNRRYAPSATRLEAALSVILGGPSVTYSSGLAAYQALLTHVNPKRLILLKCYPGCLAVSTMHSRISGMELLRSPPRTYQSGDLVHLETPGNPSGVATRIETLAAKLHSVGAELCIDSTFAPPPIQNPFHQGADYVLHSMTKYLGGNLDVLGGVVTVKSEAVARKLLHERSHLGSVMSSLDSWLELSALRTLPLRIRQASSNATVLAGWLNSLIPHPVVRNVTHESLQAWGPWLSSQLPGGFGPIFSLTLHTERMAESLPNLLRLFRQRPNLGGVESMIEWLALTDDNCDRRILRVSVGVEDAADLKRDLEAAIAYLARQPPPPEP